MLCRALAGHIPKDRRRVVQAQVGLAPGIYEACEAAAWLAEDDNPKNL